jgi:hypothetical protein
MFDWKAAAPNPVISDRFWVYWAFTLPVTFVVFVFFYVFVLVDFSSDSLAKTSSGLADNLSLEQKAGETLFQTFKRRRQQASTEQEPKVHPRQTTHASAYDLNELPSFYSKTQ